MRHHNLLATAALAVSLSTPAFAQDDEDRATYFTVLGTYTQFDENRNIDASTNIEDGGGIEFILGQQRASGFGFELSLFGDFVETGADNGTDFYRPGLGLDMVYGMGDRASFTPFLLLGGGVAYNDVFPDDRDDYDWFANAGLGFVSGPINKYNTRLRLEVKYVLDNFEGSYDDYRAGLGIELPMSSKPKVIERVVEKVKVVEIPASGGLSDSDNDGIIDGRDQCPNTPANTRVNGDGCPLGDVVALEGVSFETNSDRLRPDAVTILNEAAEVLTRYPEMIVEVAGHTDSIGSDVYNQSLSQKRAETVMQYLVDRSVSADRLSAVGYGESEPRDSNDTAEGRERNRRVELRIQN